VKIKTPSGHGTAFLVAYNKSRNLMAIATAAHVVTEVDEWRLPLKIIPERSYEPVFLEDDERVILIDDDRDSALVVVGTSAMPLPADPLPLVPKDVYDVSGCPLGWLGYPGLAPDHLCFFHGWTSAWVSRGEYYLIDGVAINGVSGGPVFEDAGTGLPRLVGLVSAYYSNREVLPGLLKAYDLTHAHRTIERWHNLGEAREAKEEAQKEEAQKEDQGPKLEAPSKEPGKGG
jgi:hypothetical protein